MGISNTVKMKPFFLSFETGFHYVAQAGLELVILLPQPPKCWYNRHAPPHWTNLSSFKVNSHRRIVAITKG
jgi:hypothetical protein